MSTDRSELLPPSRRRGGCGPGCVLRLWQTDRTFEGDDHLRYFLVRVTLNVCKDISRSPLGAAARCPWRAAGSRPFPHRSDRSCSGRCWRCPGKYRLPLYLYYYEGYSVKEVGELLDLKPSTVQTRLARARTKLKEELEA